MRVALVNPAWTFEGSIYFGCREAHLPLELGYSKAMLERNGHEVVMLDGLLEQSSNAAMAEQVAAFAAELTMVVTAPTYLFWRCPPPELRVPADFLQRLAGRGGRTVIAGPHPSITPGPALAKTHADLAIIGECEEVITALADNGASAVAHTAERSGAGRVRCRDGPHASRFADHPALVWPDRWVRRHNHHHHRFERPPEGPGAEVEASRGCPYSCTFCAKLAYRDSYRRRDLEPLVEEIDRLIGQGARYLYFIDEIFLPQPTLLEALAERDIAFGVQTRIDLWKPALLALLGQAGCVSIEAGVESLTEAGRAALAKRCAMSTAELTERLIIARHHVPFVQANLIGELGDDAAEVTAWRDELQAHGVWANDPVPLYPYPASPDYRKLWGEPDDLAWERAHEHYLSSFSRFSDIQEQRPARLAELEEQPCRH
ncbi:MAG: TIGR04295 family B12-binding domain-containing radical SAM protein [Aestuariivirgaceae bacterium]